MIMDLVVETAVHSDQNITTELSSLLVQSEVILRINVTSLCHLIYIKCDCSFKVTRPTYFPITCPCSRLACCVTTGKPRGTLIDDAWSFLDPRTNVQIPHWTIHEAHRWRLNTFFFIIDKVTELEHVCLNCLNTCQSSVLQSLWLGILGVVQSLSKWISVMFGFWKMSVVHCQEAVSSLFSSVFKAQSRSLSGKGFVKAWQGDRDAANTSIFTIQTWWMEKDSLLPKFATARAWVQLVLYKQHINYCLFFLLVICSDSLLILTFREYYFANTDILGKTWLKSGM